MSIPLPSTVLFPRDRNTAGELSVRIPKLALLVTVEFDNLTLATPVEIAEQETPTVLFDARQLSMFNSAAAAV